MTVGEQESQRHGLPARFSVSELIKEFILIKISESFEVTGSSMAHGLSKNSPADWGRRGGSVSGASV